jgi:hypothetical protein
MSEMDFSKILDSSASNSSVQKTYCSSLLDAMNQDSDDESVEAVESMTLNAQMIDQLESCTVKRSLFPVSAHRNGSPVLSDPPPAQNPPKCQTKKSNWGPVPAVRQSKRNIGKGDVMERAKQYKMKHNLEVPATFKGNSFAILHHPVLSDVSDSVDFKIGDNIDEKMRLVKI